MEVGCWQHVPETMRKLMSDVNCSGAYSMQQTGEKEVETTGLAQSKPRNENVKIPDGEG